MTTDFDYIVVGSGLTGATIARRLHGAGCSVLVLERRNHVGGNVHDHVHASGIRIHTYGPHYFRTSSEQIWSYVTGFSDFFPFAGVIQSFVDGAYERWPVAVDYIRRHIGEAWQPAFQGTPSNFEEASLALMPREIYEKFIKGYSEKQWGVPAHTLSAELAGRFEVRENGDARLKLSPHQGIPSAGYAGFMSSMLEGIPVILNCDYLRCREMFRPRRLLIYTGAIDEYFNFCRGRLHYRGQRREDSYHADAQLLLPCGQVNNPDPAHGPHIRTLEWKHMMPREYAEKIRGTVLTTETTVSPASPEHYEYPMPDARNRALYMEYKQLAMEIPNLLICGRLGEYRYYDMDQAIERALGIAERILAVSRLEGVQRSVSAAADEIRALNARLLGEEGAVAVR